MKRWIYDTSGGEERAVLVTDGRAEEIIIRRHLMLNLEEVVEGRIIAYHPTLRGYFVHTEKGKDVFVPSRDKHTEGESVRVRIRKEARADKDATGDFVTDETEGVEAFLPLLKTLEMRFPTEERVAAAPDEIDTILAGALAERVALSDGATLRFEGTSVCQTIDVDSAKSRRHWRLINAEAVAEIMRQVRLRHIGGLILIDFAGTKTPAVRRTLERLIADAAKSDSALSLDGWTPGGLFEMKRCREYTPLSDLWHTPENAFYRICRAMKASPKARLVRAHPKVAALLEGIPYLSVLPDFTVDINTFDIKEKP